MSTVSGDGAAGGDFVFRFDVLPSDTDGNRTVSIGESLQRRLRVLYATGTVGYIYREDIDGSGSISIGEALQARLAILTTITTLNEPIVPGGSPLTAEALPEWLTAENDEPISPYAPLTTDELAPLVAEAIARWEASGLVPADARPALAKAAPALVRNWTSASMRPPFRHSVSASC